MSLAHKRSWTDHSTPMMMRSSLKELIGAGANDRKEQEGGEIGRRNELRCGDASWAPSSLEPGYR
jgi:hypothetical protein